MACKCIDETYDYIKNNLSDKNEEWKDRNITSVDFQNIAWLFDGTGKRVYSPMTIEYDIVNKKGELKHKKEKSNMNYTYCPFCGKKYKED